VTCPPAGFDSATGINIRKYINGPWYVQEQVCMYCAQLVTHYSYRHSTVTDGGILKLRYHYAHSAAKQPHNSDCRW
jgi:hypothetical protein